jgi:hypothetical protein
MNDEYMKGYLNRLGNEVVNDETATQPPIKASELRVGNWVQVSSGVLRLQVESIHENGINVWASIEYGHTAVIDPDYGYNNLGPIPLSPEILEKCGFEKSGELNNTRYWRREPYVSFSFGDYAYYRDDYRANPNLKVDNQTIYPERLIYLHQLQNLYFALTGEELRVNL